jgi:glycine cleavage system aminomethyltransferase T
MGRFEAGLDRFVDLGKNDFIGRERPPEGEAAAAANCAASR